MSVAPAANRSLQVLNATSAISNRPCIRKFEITMSRFVIGFLLATAAFAQSPGERALTLNTLGNQFSDAGDYEGAARSYRDAIEIWQSMGADYDAHRAG